MELILLLLMGGLAAGAGLWAASSKKDDKAPPHYSPPGSSPPPGAGDRPGGPPGGGSPGESVIHGKDPAGDREKEGPLSDQAGPGPSQKKPPGGQGGPPELTYSTDEIIPPNSQYAFQRRPLKNAEALADKNKARDAASLFEKIKNRIPDSDIKSKIDQNIQDLNQWLDDEEAEASGGEGPYRYPETILPVKPQLEVMESLADGLKSIAEELGHTMAEALMNLQKNT